MNVETLLTGWGPTVVDVRWVTELPADLAGNLGLVRVLRLGGPDTEPGLDVATVDVEYFAADRVAAFAGANSVRDALRFSLPGHTTADGSVSKVRTISGPAWRPYDDPDAIRYGALYEITLHAAG